MRIQITLDTENKEDKELAEKLLRVLSPSPQAKYNRRVRSSARPAEREEESLDLATLPEEPSEPATVRFVRYTNINGVEITRRLDGSEDELERMFKLNKGLKPNWVTEMMTEAEAMVWVDKNLASMSRDDSNSWRY